MLPPKKTQLPMHSKRTVVATCVVMGATTRVREALASVYTKCEPNIASVSTPYRPTQNVTDLMKQSFKITHFMYSATVKSSFALRQIHAFDDSHLNFADIKQHTPFLLVPLPPVQTCIWPGPPGLYQSDPEMSFWSFRQQSTGEVFSDVIIEDGQTAVVRQTSVDCCEPGNVISVNLVTCRVVDNSVFTPRLCIINHAFLKRVWSYVYTG